MSKQERVQKPQSRDSKGRYSKETEHAEVPVEREPKTQEEIDAIDALLDEIDSVLEENAQEFVANYVQKGGE